MLKQKKIIIAVISVFIVVVAGISVFLLVKKDKNNNPDPVENNSRVVNIDGESEEPGVVAVGGDFLGRQGVLYFDEYNMLTFVDASSGKRHMYVVILIVSINREQKAVMKLTVRRQHSPREHVS